MRSNRPLNSYSQCGEDLLLAHFLPLEDIGTYVDVGSGHPITRSNTYLFYRSGWSGLLIDPLAANVEQSRKRRPRDRVVQATAGEATTDQQLYVYDPYELTTTSVDRVRELEALGHQPTGVRSIHQVRLGDLGLHAKPSEPTLLSIDVEGAELSVLQGIDWDAYLPSAICVEELKPPLTRVTPVQHVLERQGYELRSVCVWTSIYVHCEFPGA
jgi:FkbM family methyltransferase